MTDPRDDDGDRDATRSGAPSPGARAPGAPSKAAHEETHVGGSVPVLPGAKPPLPPAPPREDADAAKTVVEEDLEETVFETHSPFSLMRVKPSGHGVPIRLSASSYVLGRSRSCDIQLFSPSSHRRHAKLLERAGGWVLEAIDNSIVIANGDLVRGEVQVVHKMRLQLGDDELVFFDERKAGLQPRAAASVQAPARRTLPPTVQIAAIVVAVAAGCVLLWWWVM